MMLNIKKIFNSLLVCISLAGAAAALSSCDGAMYEGLEPCTAQNRLFFVWNYHLKWSDAFKEEVKSVAVYGFDKETDKFAWVITEKGEKLAADGYYIDLNQVKPGTYNIVAWCGLENEGEQDETFTMPKLTVGESTRQDLICYLEREVYSDGTHHSAVELWDLYHGMLDDVTIFDPNKTASDEDHTYTVYLKKNTNNVRIILQQLNGRDIEAVNFKYTIEEDNGTLNHDNSLNPNDQTINYHEFQKMAGWAGVTDPEDYPETGVRAWDLPKQVSLTPDTRAITNVKVAVADLKVSRLMKDKKSMLTIRTKDDDIVARIPLTDYALLIKGNYAKPMGDQEYLDRQDHYELTFFLSREYDWLGTTIIINSWRVVLNHEELK